MLEFFLAIMLKTRKINVVTFVQRCISNRLVTFLNFLFDHPSYLYFWNVDLKIQPQRWNKCDWFCTRTYVLLVVIVYCIFQLMSVRVPVPQPTLRLIPWIHLTRLIRVHRLQFLVLTKISDIRLIQRKITYIQLRLAPGPLQIIQRIRLRLRCQRLIRHPRLIYHIRLSRQRSPV